MKTLLALDPAAEASVSDTGYALLQYDDGTMPEVVKSGVINGGFEGFVQWLQDGFPDVDEIVCEKYITYNKVADPSPLLIEGVVRHLAPNVVLQPSSALAMVTEEDLKRLGLYSTSGHHRDENSAIRHALYYLRSQRHTPTLRALTTASRD